MTEKKENILIKKLVLGTAQFGSQYGIFNSSGFVDKNEVKKIIALFSSVGCNFIDTATDYLNSENCTYNYFFNQSLNFSKQKILF